MSNQRLTTGALLRYLRGNNKEKAILQVVGIKTIDSKVDDASALTKRYRLMLSDGRCTFSSCMLGTQLNRLIETNSLKENAIVRIDRVMVNAIDKQNGRLMLMIHELEVIQSDSERIGDPVALPLTDIINNAGGNANRFEATDNFQPATTLVPPATNVIRQDSNVLPTIDGRNNAKNSNSHNNSLSAKGGNVIDKDRVMSIDTLNPYTNKWTIKVRVSTKGAIRTYQNARGPGKLFNCDLVDQSGEIRAAAFNADCDKIHAMLEVGKVYYISRASLKPVNRQFNSLKHDYEMAFNHDTCIELCEDDDGNSIPKVQFNFIPISEVANRAPSTICDVIGVAKSAADLDTIISKTSQKEFTKRDILLVDENASITATLWGKQAEEFQVSSNPVVAFKGIRIGDFNGRTLSTVTSTLISQDPTETSRTMELHTWFEKEGKSMDLPDLSKGADIGNQQTPFKTLAQITAEGIGLNDKPDYINVKCIITLIKKDSAVYMMCPQEKCGKKVIDENNGSFRCEKCNKTYTSYKWSYMLAAEISDATGSQWISAFSNEAESLLGMTADEFGNHKLNQNENIIDDIFRKTTNRERIFKLRAKADHFNDERRIRFTCMRISDVDWSSHGRRLMEEIKHIEPVQH